MLALFVIVLLTRACLAEVSISCSISSNSLAYRHRNQPASVIVTFNDCGTLNFNSTVVSSIATLFKANDAVNGKPVPLSVSSIGTSSVTFSIVANSDVRDVEVGTGKALNVVYTPYFVNIPVLSCNSTGELRTPLTCQTSDWSRPVVIKALYSTSTTAAGTLCVQFSENVTSTSGTSELPANSLVVSPPVSGNTVYSALSPNSINNSSSIYCSVFPAGWGTSTPRTVSAARQIAAIDLSGNAHRPVPESVLLFTDRPSYLLSAFSDKIYDIDNNGVVDSCYITFIWPVRIQAFRTHILDQNLIACRFNTTHTAQINDTVFDGDPAAGLFIKYNEVSSVEQGSPTSPFGLGLNISNAPSSTARAGWSEQHGLPDTSNGTLFAIPWNYTTPMTAATSNYITRDVAPGVAVYATANMTTNRITYRVSESSHSYAYTATTGNRAPMVVDLQTGVHYYTTSVSSTSNSNTRFVYSTTLSSEIFNASMFALVIPFDFDLGTSSATEGRLFHYLPFTNEEPGV